MNDVGVVIVCYNTDDIIVNAVESIYKYVDVVYIVDNSDENNDCFRVCDELSNKYENVLVHHTKENIGHGLGLNTGINNINTKHIICMDSDTVLIEPNLINEMMQILENDSVYGCGRVLKLNGFDYLYLPFCMFKRDTFFKYSPFIHDGAPFRKTMNEIKNKKKIVQIPDFKKKIFHRGRSTREIAGHWRKGFGGKSGV